MDGKPRDGGSMKQKISFWVPALFCAFLSFIALFRSSGESWRPAFFCFLPMCFFFVGSALLQMHRQVRSLQERLEQLEQKRAA
jgi:hypothetical protein